MTWCMTYTRGANCMAYTHGGPTQVQSGFSGAGGDGRREAAGEYRSSTLSQRLAEFELSEGGKEVNQLTGLNKAYARGVSKVLL